MKDLTRKVALLTALKDAVEAELELARAETKESLIKARDDMGLKSVEVTLPDGQVVATVTVAGGGESVAVYQEGTFVEWVRAHHPDEIVEIVRPTFRKDLLSKVGQVGDRFVVVGTGEIVEGVGPHRKAEYISVRFKPEGREQVALAWRNGNIESLLSGNVGIDKPELVR